MSRRIRSGTGAWGSASARSKNPIAFSPSSSSYNSAVIAACASALRISTASALLSSTITIWRRRAVSSDRDGEAEIRSLAGLGFDPDPAMITFDNSLTDRESDTGPRVSVCAVESCKQAKDLLLKLGLNADAIVANGKHPRVASPFSPDM